MEDQCALGQENVVWGTTNFTSGYQNVAGDTSAGVGTGGSATAMGYRTVASGRSSMSANKYTNAINQASTSLGLGTTADNFGMLAIGVNNAAGLGDTTIDPENYGGYYYSDGQYTGSNPGVAFVVGNGDINSSTGLMLVVIHPMLLLLIMMVLQSFLVIYRRVDSRLKLILIHLEIQFQNYY